MKKAVLLLFSLLSVALIVMVYLMGSSVDRSPIPEFEKSFEENVTQNTFAETALKTQYSRYVNFVLTREESDATLKGNFRRERQIREFENLFRARGVVLDSSKAKAKATIPAIEAIEITKRLIPVFATHSSQGSLTYADNLYTVSGIVDTKSSHEKIETILGSATILTESRVLIYDSIPGFDTQKSIVDNASIFDDDAHPPKIKETKRQLLATQSGIRLSEKGPKIFHPKTASSEVDSSEDPSPRFEIE